MNKYQSKYRLIGYPEDKPWVITKHIDDNIELIDCNFAACEDGYMELEIPQFITKLNIQKHIPHKRIRLIHKDNHITDLNEQFKECSATEIDLRQFDIAGIRQMHATFKQCRDLEIIRFPRQNSEQLKDMRDCFSGCRELQCLDLKDFQAPSIEYLDDMLQWCISLTEIDTKFLGEGKKLQDLSRAFRLQGITSLDLQRINSDYSLSCLQMCDCCDELEEVNLGKLQVVGVTQLSWAFQNCKKLRKININNVNTKECTQIDSMFTMCEQLKELDMSNMDLGKCKKMQRFVEQAKRLRKLQFNGQNLQGILEAMDFLRKADQIYEIDFRNQKLSYSIFSRAWNDLVERTICVAIDDDKIYNLMIRTKDLESQYNIRNYKNVNLIRVDTLD